MPQVLEPPGLFRLAAPAQDGFFADRGKEAKSIYFVPIKDD